jgi:hypothetical protein
MPPRARWEGSTAHFVQLLLPFVVSVSWLRYGEKPKDPVQPDVLKAHRHLVQVLTALCPTLAFKKQTVDDAFNVIARIQNFPELSNPDLVEDWSGTMTARLRLLCRHVAHTRARREKPQWLRFIDGPGLRSDMAAVTGAEHDGGPDDGHDGVPDDGGRLQDSQGLAARFDPPSGSASSSSQGDARDAQEAQTFIRNPCASCTCIAQVHLQHLFQRPCCERPQGMCQH